MTLRTSRRRFIAIVPISGLALLAACSKTAEPTTATSTPAVPAPAPAPVATPSPTPEPVPATSTASLPMQAESEAQAQTVGYVADAARADKTRFPAHVAGSRCANCALFQGKAGDAAGGCPIFQGKQVVAGGWCSAWAKRA